MNEAGHTAAFNKVLKEQGTYALKISLRRGCETGIPDCWYSGTKRDLWVEWKAVKKLPRKLDVTKLLTPNQRNWLIARAAEGRAVGVFVATPQGILDFRGCPTTYPVISKAEAMSRLTPRKTLARLLGDELDSDTAPARTTAEPRTESVPNEAPEPAHPGGRVHRHRRCGVARARDLAGPAMPRSWRGQGHDLPYFAGADDPAKPADYVNARPH